MTPDSAPPPLVKICGITRVEDGVLAVSAGADWLGFIRWPGSRRFRPLEECAHTLGTIRRKAPRAFQAVAVYVDADAATVAEEVRVARFDRVQFHGNETPETVAAILARVGVPGIRAIRVAADAAVEDLEREADRFPDIDLLADTADPVAHGGTGRAFDPALAAPLCARRRVILAGGLRPETVAEAVARARPCGVDVASGVETSPGVKDPEKLRAFLRAARGMDGSATAPERA